MQSTTTTRPLGSERHPSRRGHAPQISISDTNHHVTEAIGGMYGSDDDDYPSPQQQIGKTRPLSFLRTSPPRSPNQLASMQDRIQVRGESSKSAEPMRKSSLGHGDGAPISPPPTLSRSSSLDNTATQQFPLNDIDYESSPAAVAQELSNLQAIRRMSMNVDMADPDLPAFGGGFGIPALPPSPTADEDDPSKLFWVPARLHPELAPKEFKTFVEDRVERFKRLSDEGQSLSPVGLERQTSGGIKRKKSMLSRQINNDRGYEDGAERLERQRSQSGQHETVANLAELENLVNDPSSLMRKLSIDTVRKSQDSAIGVPAGDDMPMIPGLPGGLKRSTRTAYRRGSLRKGERAPASRRAVGRHNDLDDSPAQSPVLGADEPVPGLSRVRTDPVASSASEPAENFSRPGRRTRPQLGPSTVSEDHVPQIRKSPTPEEQRPQSEHSNEPRTNQFHSRLATGGGWTTAQLPGPNAPVPHIIETPPPPESAPQHIFPERKSSIQQPAQPGPRPQGPLVQSARSRLNSEEKKGPTLDDLSSHPSLWPGSGGSRTDELTQVPTYDSKKADSKGGRKTSWGWLTGGEKDKDKQLDKSDREAVKEAAREREREKEREREAAKLKEREDKERDKDKLRRPKVSSKLAASSADKTRLDVLQTSIDSAAPSRGRKSLVLNREDIKLEEERAKTSRKSKDEPTTKQKDGLLSALFGGGKRNKSSGSAADEKKRNSQRSLSPEPPPRVLKPDIDYNWTRFSILEERAIYRMAHIKLANPKRALYSQVLLSNFMYSYLAKVQMMHPQMQLKGQKQQQQAQQSQREEKRAKSNEDRQAEEFVQYQRWQEQQARLEGSQEQQQAAETGSLAGRRSPEGAYTGQGYGQNNGMNGHGQGQSGYGGGNLGASSGQQQQYETDFLGYGKNQQPFDDDDEGWDEGENMFEGLSNR
ncbi:hypothetical protein KVT40_002279 [Elsinoe batatas]|uniref:Protein Zds1 C-terminal domain-containing protein n=1 Tax=Elsinoe batatas TaxID=2601811 RepID=A0A8K0PFT6_9PEZI|nr:hypothetical protein KVT40_002279 [Elsinoe batatas]